MEVVFVLRGKTVDLGELEDVRERAILREIERSVKNRVGSLTCSEHGAAPTLTARGSRADALEFDLTGCCQDLIEKTTAALG